MDIRKFRRLIVSMLAALVAAGCGDSIDILTELRERGVVIDGTVTEAEAAVYLDVLEKRFGVDVPDQYVAMLAAACRRAMQKPNPDARSTRMCGRIQWED